MAYGVAAAFVKRRWGLVLGGSHTQGAPFDKLMATLGFRAERLRRLPNIQDASKKCARGGSTLGRVTHPTTVVTMLVPVLRSHP
jgi:hypothetical protein